MPIINEDTFRETSNYGFELFKIKNADYGDSVEKSILKRGLQPNLIRLDDKINRADVLLERKAQVKTESLYDTLVDLGNYAYMLATFVKGTKPEERKETTCNQSKI